MALHSGCFGLSTGKIKSFLKVWWEMRSAFSASLVEEWMVDGEWSMV